jgi:hypothetical protein
MLACREGGIVKNPGIFTEHGGYPVSQVHIETTKIQTFNVVTSFFPVVLRRRVFESTHRTLG